MLGDPALNQLNRKLHKSHASLANESKKKRPIFNQK